MTARDRCGAPLVELPSGRFIHLLPISIYTVERWIWSTAPEDRSALALVPSSRPRPNDLRSEDLPGVLASGFSFELGTAIARWLGGRPATESEWDQAEPLWHDSALFSQSVSEALQTGVTDARLASFYSRILASGTSTRSDVVGVRLVDVVSKQPGELHGLILGRGRVAGVVNVFGRPATATCDPDFTMTCVFDSPNP
jgi:hypothetical protein